MAMFTISFTFMIFCAKIYAQTAAGDGKEDGNRHDKIESHFYPTGDARICLDLGRRTGFPLKRFSSLPGTGWDNLRNEAAGQVFAFNYTQCKTTEDGRYLIPDAIFTIPVKSSHVETFAEIYDSWNNITSMTSRSINVDAGLSVDFYGVSGSYSMEHSRVKQKQIQDNTIATRVQLRYCRYRARLQPDSVLHPVFKSRLLSIASDLNQNLTQSAFYKAQLLVRSFGTHVLTNVVAGASLVKTDFVTRRYFARHTHEKSVVTASASVDFWKVFQMSSSFKQTTTDRENTAYKRGKTYSYVTTHGGPLYRPYNMTVSQWVQDVDSEMVPLDRFGDPLFLVITPEMFPGLPLPLVELLVDNIREAVIQYYEMNTIRGCTKLGSPNFSFSANLDDGSCVQTKNNLTFGGVYQTCSVSGRYLSHNPCSGLTQVNPLTKGYRCPSDYKSVLLHNGVKLGHRESSRRCRRCGFFWLSKCCDTTYYQARGRYYTYWCAASVSVSRSSGYLFGGTWSYLSTNLVTKSKKCPPYFYPLRILQEHYICVSDDYELASPHSVPFGGFTSCSIGNPLDLLGAGKSQTELEVFMQKSSHWPKRCPEGFSQHLTAIDDACEIRYCIKTGALTGPNLNTVKRPPFSSKPESIGQTEVYTITNNDNSIQGESMLVPESVFDQEVKGANILSAELTAPILFEFSGHVGLLPSSFMSAIAVVVLMWNQLGD